jgi:hypothetical protein
MTEGASAMAKRFVTIRNGALALLLILACGPAASDARAADYTFVLPITEGQLPANMRIIRVKQNDTVKLQWSADRGMVLHLHGYDIEKTVTAGSPAEMTFTARMTGRFPVEVHGQGHGNTLVYIEVLPN